jgi:hypothetical protein
MFPAGILENVATGRFHPIVFRRAPTPGEADETLPAQRYKSRGHHTDGFKTVEEAKDFIAEHPDWLDTQIHWEWSGDDMPAMVAWFSTNLTPGARLP